MTLMKFLISICIKIRAVLSYEFGSSYAMFVLFGKFNCSRMFQATISLRNDLFETTDLCILWETHQSNYNISQIIQILTVIIRGLLRGWFMFDLTGFELPKRIDNISQTLAILFDIVWRLVYFAH